MNRQVVITGLGSVSALGNNTDQFWEALREGRSGIDEFKHFSTENLNTPVGAEVKDFDPSEYITPKDMALFDRFSQFALAATTQAVTESELEKAQLKSAAVILGTGCGSEETYEDSYRRLYLEGRTRLHPLTVPRGMPCAAVSRVSIHFGITGPVFSVSSACSSSAHAIIQAATMIRSGLVDVAIAGGTEAPFAFGQIKAWEGLKVLSQDTCRPFSEDRSGLVLGEGSGIVVLESKKHAHQRGANILAELLGFGMSSDAGHITAPSAEGAAKAISNAITDAGVSCSEVDYVNAHGTGTQANDITETAAIHSVFGEHAQRLAITSTKSMHGHPLGAAGGLELIATVCAIREGVVPPTANFTKAGEGCDLDYVPNEARDLEITTAMSNSFAFGGLNAVLVLRKPD